MTKLYIKEVNRCSECPDKKGEYSGLFGYSNRCIDKDKYIVAVNTIPDWCPLDDVVVEDVWLGVMNR